MAHRTGTRPRRRRAALAASTLVLIAGAVAPAQAAADVDARIQGQFAMKGKITRADNVRGEHKGESVKRKWRFTSKCAAGPPCASVVLHRERSAHKVDKLTLKRIAPGTYSGKGRFYFPLGCAGQVYDRGGEARVKIVVHVTSATTVQSDSFATAIKATYSNPRRINHTECHGDLGRDGASYKGTVNATPGPPHGAFSKTGPTPPSRTVSFQDKSKRGPGDSPISTRVWDFGDPASGAKNSASGKTPKHTFSAPGVYTVTETLTDDNGLTTNVSKSVTVPL